jgi:Holliday junction resolvase RusA-like endonuclease
MVRELRFQVVGVPETKGSARGYTVQRQRRDGSKYTGVRVDNDNPKAKGWASTIRNCAAIELQRAEHRGLHFTGPVAVEFVFHLVRPKKFLTRKYESIDVPHVTRPDLDKLVRCGKDALSKVVWADDAQVIALVARKQYVATGEFPRAEIVVRDARPEVFDGLRP